MVDGGGEGAGAGGVNKSGAFFSNAERRARIYI